MSTTTTGAGVVVSVAPVTRRVRAYFAPVNRSTGVPTLFDAAQLGRFDLHAPPAPWIDLGWVSRFARKCGTKVDALRAGAPAMTVGQVRTEVEATVSLEFETWGKLQVTLASGSQQTNLLTTAAGAAPNGSGGVAAAPVPLLTGTGPASTATSLNVGAAAVARFSVGSLVAVDVDYTGQLGYVGTGVSSAYVQSASAVGGDINYVRRVTLNVGVVVAITAGVLELASPLPAGIPTAGSAGEPACRLLRSRGRELLSGMVRALCYAGRSGRSSSGSLSASPGDAGFNGDGRYVGSPTGEDPAGRRISRAACEGHQRW